MILNLILSMFDKRNIPGGRIYLDKKNSRLAQILYFVHVHRFEAFSLIT